MKTDPEIGDNVKCSECGKEFVLQIDSACFDDEYCRFETNRYGEERNFPLEIGHIISQSKGGKITDENNIIWICSRHNWMMGDMDFQEMKKFVGSMLGNL